MHTYYEPFWGMHLLWWAFWFFAMVTIFGFNVPERARINSLDPHSILKRRLAKGQIAEGEFQRINEHLLKLDESVERNAAYQTTNTSLVRHPIADGLSFSTTWALLYTLCSIFYWIAPGAMTTATSKLFHGMSFTQMAAGGTAFGFSDFASVVTIGAVFTFVAGVVWSLVRSYFLRRGAQRNLDRVKVMPLKIPRLTA